MALGRCKIFIKYLAIKQIAYRIHRNKQNRSSEGRREKRKGKMSKLKSLSKSGNIPLELP